MSPGVTNPPMHVLFTVNGVLCYNEMISEMIGVI